MKHGHVTGTRRTRSATTRWYDAIAQATLAQLAVTWPEDNSTPQEVPQDPTHAPGRTDHDTGSNTHQGARSMPQFTPKTVNDPSNLTHGRHPAFLLAIVEEAIPDGWQMGQKDTLMFRWHLAIWEHVDHMPQYAPEQQSAISSRAFSPKGKFQASKSWVWACALLGREIPKGQGVDLDPLMPIACWADVSRTPGNDYAKIEALWGRPEGQAQVPPIVRQLRAQYATAPAQAQPNGHAAPAPPPPAPPQWGQPGPQAPASRVPGGWPGAVQPAQTTQAPAAQPTLPGTAPRGPVPF